MQHDAVIWNSLHRHFCSYRVTTSKINFCRNKYNITGLCEQKSCPLANSLYATIIENDGRLLLFIKTAERAHSPRRLWEKISLSQSYRKALLQIDAHLQYWPQFNVHKAKQRLTKMTQYLIRKQKLQLQTQTRLVGVKKKIQRREASREKKAMNAAKLENSIEKELLERLRVGAYGDIYNFPQEEYEKALDSHLEEQREEEEEYLQDQDEYEAVLEDSDEEFGLLEDIEDHVGDAGQQFDFDDGDDSGEESDETNEEGNRVRSDQELKEYVKSRALKRVRSKRKSADDRTGSKGLKLRRTAGLIQIEVEYAQEGKAQAQLQAED